MSEEIVTTDQQHYDHICAALAFYLNAVTIRSTADHVKATREAQEWLDDNLAKIRELDDDGTATEDRNMGRIDVTFSGSFGARQMKDTALSGGHATALARVISKMTDMLPEMVRKDHELHTAGEHPPMAPFGMDGRMTVGEPIGERMEEKLKNRRDA